MVVICSNFAILAFWQNGERFGLNTCVIFILDKTAKKHSPQNPPGE